MPRGTSRGSYDEVMLLWTAPALPGSSPIASYTWVEFVGGRPVLTGDVVQLVASGEGSYGYGGNGSEAVLATKLFGFRKGYGILQGAIAALNAGGYSEFSDPWPAATMGLLEVIEGIARQAQWNDC